MTREEIVKSMSVQDAIEVLKDTNTYGTADIAKTVAIETMNKYQKIEQIYQKWNEVNDFSYNQAMQKISEVLEDGNDDN
jgi:hypothetical protein